MSKRFIFEVMNNRTEKLAVIADTEEEARVKLGDFDIEYEDLEVFQDDYVLDEAIVDSVEDIEE